MGQVVAGSLLARGEYTDCRPTTTPLAFDGGYRVSMCFETKEGTVGEARAGIWASDQSGLLWFFSRGNAEVLVKVLDGCSHNGHRWIFVAPVTDVAFNLHVTSVGGREWTHRNRLGETAATASDTSAFDCAADDDVGSIPGVFPDPNLRSAIEAALGLRSGEPVTRAALETLTVLEAAGADIRDLTGLEWATGLTELNLSGNSIDDVSPLAGLTELTGLVLEWNEIEDLAPLAGLGKLKVLLAGYNAIDELWPLAGLTQLDTLYLARNVIKDVSPLAGLTELGSLRLGHNAVDDLRPLAGLTNLRHLDLAFNSFRDVSPLARLANLRHLGLWGNLIEDVGPLSGLNQLNVLYLGANRLEDVSALSGLTHLVVLDLGSNRLEDVGPLAGLTRLTLLSLSLNEIRDVSPLDGLLEMDRLRLQFNLVEDVSPLVGLHDLGKLDLRGNPLDRESIAVEVPALLRRQVDVEFDWFKSKRGFDIELVFLEDFSDAHKRLVEWAARRWMAVLPEDLPDVVVDRTLALSCDGIPYEIPGGERIDDLRVYVTSSFDPWGPNGWAGGQAFRDDNESLPFRACVNIDVVGDPSWTAVHELAHALGFSALVPGWRRFLQKADDGRWHFGGPRAVEAFRDAGGSGYTGPGVPLRVNDRSHWGGPVAGELMGPQTDARHRPLSAITIQALADIGYSVDVTQADEYVLPGAATTGSVGVATGTEFPVWFPDAASKGADGFGGLDGECSHPVPGDTMAEPTARGYRNAVEARRPGSP